MWTTLHQSLRESCPMRTLGTLIRELRDRRRLTQEELAVRSGVSSATIKNLELDKRKSMPNTLLAIMRTLSERAPLSVEDAAELSLAANIDRAVLTPFVQVSEESTTSTREQCEILLSELLRGVDPGAVAMVLHSLIALRGAVPRAVAVRPAEKVLDPTSLPVTRPDPTHVRVLVEEGPMPGVPGATQKLYRAYPIAQAVLAESLSASLDLPAARIADAIAKATRAS